LPYFCISSLCKSSGSIIAENWRRKIVRPLVQPLLITFALAFAVYGILRAIGWVIGGFMASERE
jgi:hypothetical protein